MRWKNANSNKPRVINLNKGMWSVILLSASLPVGLAAGGFLAEKLLISPYDGLGAVAKIFSSMLLGALLAFASAFAVITRCNLHQIQTLALIMLALCLSGLAWIVWFALQPPERSKQNQYHYPGIITPEIVLTIQDWDRQAIALLEYRSESDQLTIHYSDGRQCAGQLGHRADRTHRDLFETLRTVEMSGLLMYPPPCHLQGDAQAKVEFTIVEHDAPIFFGELDINTACIVEHAELADLIYAGRRLINQLSPILNCSDDHSLIP